MQKTLNGIRLHAKIVTRSSLQMSFFQARVPTRFGLRTLWDRPFNDTNCVPLSLCHWICTEHFLIAKSHRIVHLNSGRRKNRAQYRVAVQSWRRRNRKKKSMTTLAFLKRINYKKVGIISVVLILFSILFCIVFVPTFLKGQLKSVRQKAKTILQIDFHFINICLQPPPESPAAAEDWNSRAMGKSSVCSDV